MGIENRLHRLERLLTRPPAEPSIDPSREERELGKVIRRNPKLRHLAAYADDLDAFADGLRNLTEEERADLSQDERALLDKFFGSEG